MAGIIGADAALVVRRSNGDGARTARPIVSW
jgi:hypothetical protein